MRNLTKLVILALVLIALNQLVVGSYEVNWVDSFTTSDYIGSSNGLNISGGNVTLLGGYSRGNLTSVALNQYALVSYDRFFANTNRAGDANISFWIYNASGISGCNRNNTATLINYSCNGNFVASPCGNAVDNDWVTTTYTYIPLFFNFTENYTIPNNVDGVDYATWTFRIKISQMVMGFWCLDDTSSWLNVTTLSAPIGSPTTFTYRIPKNCLLNDELSLRINATEELSGVGALFSYYDRQIQFYYSINSSNASSGFNLSSCLGTQTPIYLFADFQGNNTNPALLDWNVTYYQSESSCFDFDGGLNYNIGSNVTKAGFTYADSCTGSTLTEYYCENGIIKSSTYTCPQVCQDTTRCRADCIGNVSAWSYYIATNSSQVQYLLFNLTNVDNVKLNATNVISLKQSWQRSGREFIVNATGNANTVIYLSDDITNIPYSLAAPTPNLTLQLTLANFTRINPYYNISWWIEENWTQPFTNSIYFDNETNITTNILDHKFYVYCPTSGTGYINMKQRNTTSIIIANPERPLNFLSQIDWTSNASYSRSYVPYSDTENISMYLIDWRNYAIVAITFNLVDLSYSFDNAVIRLQKYVGGTLKDMHSDYFDATDTALAYLIENGKYIVTISSGTTTNSFGWVTVTSADASKTVVVSAVFQAGKMISPYDFIDLKVSGNYSTGQICLHYNDSTAKTSWVTFFISNASNIQIYNVTTTASVATLCYSVPVLNATYLWRVQFSHPDGSIGEIGEVIDMLTGIVRRIAPLENNGVTSITGFTPTQIYKFASLICIIGIAALFGSVDAYTGAVVTGCSTVFFFYLGWLDISFVNVCVVFVLAIMGKLREGKNV